VLGHHAAHHVKNVDVSIRKVDHLVGALDYVGHLGDLLFADPYIY
jgi:hypothetical protein